MSTEVEILRANLRHHAERSEAIAKRLFEVERERDALAQKLREAEIDRDNADSFSKGIAYVCGEHERRFSFLHRTNLDKAGYEWGVYRVKWVDGRAVDVLQTNSDLSDLDAAIEADQEGAKK